MESYMLSAVRNNAESPQDLSHSWDLCPIFILRAAQEEPWERSCQPDKKCIFVYYL